jgi:hypothetical protein
VPTAAQKYLVPTNRGDYPSCALPRSGHANLEARMEFDPMISDPSNLVTKCPFSAWWKLYAVGYQSETAPNSQLDGSRQIVLDELLALLGSCNIYISGHIKPSIRHSSSESERLYRLWARDKGPFCDIWKREAEQRGKSPWAQLERRVMEHGQG